MIDKDKVKIVVIDKFIGNFVAIVPFPNTILVVKEYAESAPIIAHELVHLDQWERYGWSFYPRYISGWIKAGFSYTNNPMEVEARENYHRYLTLAKELINES